MKMCWPCALRAECSCMFWYVLIWGHDSFSVFCRNRISIFVNISGKFYRESRQYSISTFADLLITDICTNSYDGREQSAACRCAGCGSADNSRKARKRALRGIRLWSFQPPYKSVQMPLYIQTVEPFLSLFSLSNLFSQRRMCWAGTEALTEESLTLSLALDMC